MKLTVRFGAGIGIIVCIAASVLLLVPRRSRPAVVTPRPPAVFPAISRPNSKQQPVRLPNYSIHLAGTIVPSAQASLGIIQPGRVTALLVRSGSIVTAGQTVVTLDDSAAGAQFQQAIAGVATARAQFASAQTGLKAAVIKGESEVEQARQALFQAKAGEAAAQEGVSAARSQQHAQLVGAETNVAKAQSGVAQARSAWLGLKKIAAVGGASVMDVAGAKAQYMSAQQDLSAAEAQLHALNAGYKNGPPFQVSHAQQQLQQASAGVSAAAKGLVLAQRGASAALSAAHSQLDAARAGVQQAEAGQAGAEAASAMTRVVSPIGGVVTSTAIHVGEIAQPGMPLVTIVSTTDPGAEALAPMRDMASLFVGDSAIIQVSGYKPIHAVVSWVSPVASPDGRNFRVKFRLIRAPFHLPPASGAEITVDSHR